MKIILKVGIRFKTYLRKARKKTGLFVDFGQFPRSWIRIRIRIPNRDPDPGQPNQCGY